MPEGFTPPSAALASPTRHRGLPPHLAESAVVAVAEEAVRAELYRHAAELAAEACRPGLTRAPAPARRRRLAMVAPWVLLAGVVAAAWRWRR